MDNAHNHAGSPLKARAVLAAVLWFCATPLGAGVGILIARLAKPEEDWVGYCLLGFLFVAQYVMLASVRIQRPLLPSLGLTLGFLALFVGEILRRHDMPAWLVTLAYTALPSAAWAGAVSRTWKHALAWLVCGSIAVYVGFLLGGEVAGLLRDRNISKSTAAVSSIITSAGITGLLTAPIVWWFALGEPPAHESVLSETKASTARQRYNPSRSGLLVGRLILCVVGVYSVAIGVYTLMGRGNVQPPSDEEFDRLVHTLSEDELMARLAVPEYPHNAVDLGWLNTAGAVLCIVVGTALVLRQNWARHLFLLCAPLGTLTIASRHATSYWQHDIPVLMIGGTMIRLMVLLGLVFGVCVLLLGRQHTIAAATHRRDGTSRCGTWVHRCVPIAVGLLIASFCAYLYVKSTKQTYRRSSGFMAAGMSMNEYVKHLVMTHLFLWHTIPGAIASAVPFLFWSKREPGLDLTKPEQTSAK
ncbi:MAG: hypothetical protein H6815_04830 [Phycisphaeraceae bacterium]|nr:hypothetical protein [Phycisphaerales bacterium]MCB9859759.1 hypothetical protein [Phycisphaeraceae bacterium]